MAKEKKFINQAEEDAIIAAIQVAEKNTSGEIRVHIEANCKGVVKERVKELFYELKMHQTKRRNGVLIYLAANDRQFFIFGDKGIYEKTPDNFWQGTKDAMQAHFQQGEFVTGLCEGILMIGEQLKKYFPYRKGDINELPDEISRG